MIGENIAYYRKIQGLSQRKLADELKVSNTYISQIENDKTIPSDEMLKKIAAKLKVKTEDLQSEKSSEDDKIVALLLELTKQDKVKWEIRQIEHNGLISVHSVLDIGDIIYDLSFGLELNNNNKITNKILYYSDIKTQEQRELYSNLINDLIMELRTNINDSTSKHNQIKLLNRLLEN